MRIPLVFAMSLSSLMLANVQAQAAASVIPQCAPQQPAPSPIPLRYVAIGAAQVREQANPEAKLVDALPITTQLEVQCQQDGWYAISAMHRYKQVKGWLPRAETAENAPTMASLFAQFHKAETTFAARQIAEYAVMLEPFSISAQQLLLDSFSEREGAERDAALARLLWLRHPQADDKGEEKATIFIHDGYLKPLAKLDHGKLVKYPPDKNAQGELNTLGQTVLRQGRALYSYSNGGEAGVTVVRRAGYHGCDPEPEDVKFLRKNGEYEQAEVVSNFPLTSRQPQRQQRIIESQKQILQQLARTALLNKKVPNAHLAKIFDANHDYFRDAFHYGLAQQAGEPYPILIMTLDPAIHLPLHQKARKVQQYRLRLIAEADAKGQYHTRYSEFAKPRAEIDFENVRFMTHMDLNLDGRDELIFKGTGWEWSWVDVIAKVNGKWKIQLRGADVGCR